MKEICEKERTIHIKPGQIVVMKEFLTKEVVEEYVKATATRGPQDHPDAQRAHSHKVTSLMYLRDALLVVHGVDIDTSGNGHTLLVREHGTNGEYTSIPLCWACCLRTEV